MARYDGSAAEAVVSAEAQDADPQAVAPHEEVTEEPIARQQAGYEALTRSYERTRELSRPPRRTLLHSPRT